MKIVVEDRIGVARELETPPDRSRPDAFSWLLTFGATGFEKRIDAFLIEELERVVEERGYPLTDIELRFIGTLGRVGFEKPPLDEQISQTDHLFMRQSQGLASGTDSSDHTMTLTHDYSENSNEVLSAVLWLNERQDRAAALYTYLVGQLSQALVEQPDSESDLRKIGKLGIAAIETRKEQATIEHALAALTMPKAIELIRVANGLSQAQLAKATGVAAAQIVSFEEGATDPPRDLLARFLLIESRENSAECVFFSRAYAKDFSDELRSVSKRNVARLKTTDTFKESLKAHLNAVSLQGLKAGVQ